MATYQREVSTTVQNDRVLKRVEDGQPEKGIITLHAVGIGYPSENTVNQGQANIFGQAAARTNGYMQLKKKLEELRAITVWGWTLSIQESCLKKWIHGFAM